jgi:threonylcarbamoyladenosine tRNA methylthiotransferase MtaB
MASSPKACRHLHLPLQSGDDEILAQMKRVYTTAEYARFVEKAKSFMPDLGLGTDIMVGFPGESDHHFENSRRFLESLPFSYLHVFSYSDRAKTAANYLVDKCHPSVVRERSAILHDLAGEKKREFFGQHIGRTVNVLFEDVDADGFRKGFTGNYIRVGTPPDAVHENELSAVRIERIGEDFCCAAPHAAG